METIEVNKLKPHPRNSEFFDDIQGDNWEEFKKSIETSGVIEPVVISNTSVIVSGHQRVRACIELGIKEVPCRIKMYDSEDAEDIILKELLETNLRQRGIGNLNGVKFARCIVELERIYGVRNGSAGNKGTKRHNNVSQLNYSTGKTPQQELAENMGVDRTQLINYKKLLTLIPELQDLVEIGQMTSTVGYKVWAKLPQDEQRKLIEELGANKIAEMTQKQTEEYIKENKELKIKLKTTEELEKKISENEEEQRKLKNRISELVQQGTKTETITKEVDKPETLEKIKTLEKQLQESTQKNTKYSTELVENHKLLSKAMGESTNYQLVSHCSEITLKMLDFVKEMSKYDYMAESFNEIPNATRIEYEKCIGAVKKWADRILETIHPHDKIVKTVVYEDLSTSQESISNADNAGA